MSDQTSLEAHPMTRERLRVLFMGTPDFAVPALTELAKAGYAILVVTQPDKPVGRHKLMNPPPVKVAAESLGLFVIQPPKVRAPKALEEITAFAPDVLITAAYGQLLPQKLLDIPTVGCLNIHASLLPRWRGAAPIHRAIMAGDSVTGVTLMEMVLELDAGPIVRMQEMPIDAEDTTGSLHDKLALLGSRLLMDTLPDYVAGKIQPTVQPEVGITYAERVLRADEFIDWTRPAHELALQIRGLAPWPGAATTVGGQSLKIWSVAGIGTEPEKEYEISQPGHVVLGADGHVQVSCGSGFLRVKEVQPAGKRRMNAADWFRGQQAQSVQLG
jgi:methionyl-tRNA formyltransferase